MSDTTARHASIPQDMTFEHRSWRVQRVGWVLMLLFVLAGLLGVVGSGPLSNATSGNPDGVEIQYQRFARSYASQELIVTIAPLLLGGEQVELSITRDYLDHFEVETVIPEPEETRVDGQWITYVFNLARTDEGVHVILRLSARDFGIHSGTVRVGEDDRARFRQVIYP